MKRSVSLWECEVNIADDNLSGRIVPSPPSIRVYRVLWLSGWSTPHFSRRCLRFYEDQFEALSQTEPYNQIQQEVRAIREYVGFYETAPQMDADSVNHYRKLADYENIVLAGTYSENHGFMFITWNQDKERSYVSDGDYSPNYAYAKESFVRRSGLIQKQRFFQSEEAEKSPFAFRDSAVFHGW